MFAFIPCQLSRDTGTLQSSSWWHTPWWCCLCAVPSLGTTTTLWMLGTICFISWRYALSSSQHAFFYRHGQQTMTSAQRSHRKQYLSCQAFTILYYKVQVDWTLGTDLLIDVFFMADIALNFNTGFISDQARPVCCCLSMRTASANHHQSSHAASCDTWSSGES